MTDDRHYSYHGTSVNFLSKAPFIILQYHFSFDNHPLYLIYWCDIFILALRFPPVNEKPHSNLSSLNVKLWKLTHCRALSVLSVEFWMFLGYFEKVNYWMLQIITILWGKKIWYSRIENWLQTYYWQFLVWMLFVVIYINCWCCKNKLIAKNGGFIACYSIWKWFIRVLLIVTIVNSLKI